MRVDGRAFPAKVLALTWDDGPDATTLQLANYLASRHISATFFVVHAWERALSDDPGEGRGVFESGYAFLPVLGDLVAVGHRVANHTLNHVGLRETAGALAASHQLRENQSHIDPFLTNELRLFRPPGGGWGDFAEGVVTRDDELNRLLGPIMWDVDGKDWDASISCRDANVASECERFGSGHALRIKATVVASRYVNAIETAGHGIVLLHDRVGHVGSTYSLDVARALIPQLEARGFVFAAPVLRFSNPVLRYREREFEDGNHWTAGPIRLGDVDGDGRDDACWISPLGVSCATSVTHPTSRADRMPKTLFRAAKSVFAEPTRPNPARSTESILHLADVDGDGKLDVCLAEASGATCETLNTKGALRFFEFRVVDDNVRSTIQFGDVDGDGKSDACWRTRTGVACARSLGSRFEASREWLMAPVGANANRKFEFEANLHLADVNGDGAADVCGLTTRGVVCALSTRTSFGSPERWSAPTDFGDGNVRFGDINGDRRDDVCCASRAGIACALETIRGFTQASIWLPQELIEAQHWRTESGQVKFELGDVNGDGRADVCGQTPEGLACGLAP